jgi:flagellar protein FliS
MEGIAVYQEHAIATQSRGRLIVMLYDGAIKFLNQALRSLESGDVPGKGLYIGKAIAIVAELDTSLDMDAGGEIAVNLRRLYGFMRRHLLEANIRNDAQRIRDVIGLLQDLNEGWKAVTA